MTLVITSASELSQQKKEFIDLLLKLEHIFLHKLKTLNL